ncbi:MAG: alanine--tRNA ligase [Gemmatimonadota bacterium]|nr:alanine--tRNA ligase [Gemmatimonadota bacterium]
MKAAEVRQKFTDYFEKQGHVVLPSSPVVPADDPTIMFTNAGMVQFKKVFLGQQQPPLGRRATTVQKCVRAGGKHNDLEQVGHTARHHTFFEMLGNFSFGDYFKRDAIRFAWEFVTKELKLPPKHLRVTVFEDDDEARALWHEIAGLPDSRIYGLGAHDNFWQMADTGPCGPCTEIFIDLAHVARDLTIPAGAKGEWTEIDRKEFSKDAFVEGAEAGRFLEFWNLVFMQFDRQQDGTLVPLPKPSVDTGAGLERIAAIMQGESNNFHADLFVDLIEAVEKTVGHRYSGNDAAPKKRKIAKASGKSPASARKSTAKKSSAKSDRGTVRATVQQDSLPRGAEPASFRVIADHSRAVAFLLADGVFPSNEGRGYVLRRILRRAVRHAWLLGRREPTLVEVVRVVIDQMGDVYPELRQRARHIIDTTLAEEQRFLATIEGGMKRFDELAPEKTTQGSTAIHGTIAGEDAFKLYDTFGFPIDLTELMARERGYSVDIAGFEASLQAQRTQSQEERRSKKVGIEQDLLGVGEWIVGTVGATLGGIVGAAGGTESSHATDTVTFAGYDSLDVNTDVIAKRDLPDGRVAIMLRETPFYAESGGQISDRGEILGEGWRVDVDEVRKIDGRIAALGKRTGDVKLGKARASVPRDRRRDTERNHTATHLLHAALRQVLGEHVHQAGSLVAPDRLRFDFTHHGPLSPHQIIEVENLVNRGILDGIQLAFEQKPRAEAEAAGAMALFGEKYGDVVRVVTIPGLSMELCGGTHVRNTAEIALFKIVSETGVAAGVRRIEAVTGRGALDLLREREAELKEIEGLVRAPAGGAVKRVHTLVEDRRILEKRLEEALRSGGGGAIKSLVDQGSFVHGVKVVAANVRAPDLPSLQAMGDALREQMETGVGVLAASFDNGKNTMLAVVSDDLRDRGIRADTILRELAEAAGGKGGGKPHMAQAGIPDAARMASAVAEAPEMIRKHLAATA